MFTASSFLSSRVSKVVPVLLCCVLILSSLHAPFAGGSARAQSDRAVLKRQLPPNYALPKINDLLDEGRKLQRPDLPRPALKPSTLCGYHDRACKVKQAKEKKIGQNLKPSNDSNANQVAANTAQKNKQNWFSRIGQIASRAFNTSLLDSASVSAADANSFIGSNTALPANKAATASMLFAPPTYSTFAETKLDPRYRVGAPGEDLFSGNVNYSLPLVNLPGRAGLDVNITLSYNSLIWMKYNNRMQFDPGYYETLTPGFRLGFPEVEGPYTIATGETFIVTLPSGKRVEMRKVPSTTNQYEAIDSSYLYLVVNTTDPSQMTLYATDGTQFKFELPTNSYQSRCTQIKDSNGNYITISYKTIGDPEWPLVVTDKVTDTLGRQIVFNYDSNLHLLSITQAWQGQTFTWAQFDYGEKVLNLNFGSLGIDGPHSNESIPVITRVITGDGARHTFVYNSWGQAEDFWLYGEADNARASLDYVYPATTTAQSDCPRPSQRNDYVANWGGATGNGWVSNTFSYDSANETYGQMVDPDGVTHKELFNTSNGKRGLTSRMETWYGGSIQKFSDVTWASDITTGRPLRPRVTDTQTCDDRNHDGIYSSGTDKLSRTAISYDTYATTVKLPSTVKQYNEGGQSVYRTTVTTYVSDSNYTGITRRIIGLPSVQKLYEGDSATLVAQTEYVYDGTLESGSNYAIAHASAPRQHDSTYGVGFQYRGNPTKAKRYSVANGSASTSIETKTNYYITGTVALAKDALDHQTSIFYDDSFSGGVAPSPPTYAYPTKVTDPDSYSSAAKYNYDFGGVTETIDPKSYAVSPTSPPVKVVRSYDTKGRLEKSAVWKDGLEYSHTRYVHGPDHNYAETWTTVNSLSEETFAIHLLDGVSRERITISEHPGSVGGLKLQYLVFDKMGRVTETSNPTEIDGNWAPSGDDSTGYIYSKQAYDWKGRPTNFYPPYSNPNDPDDPNSRKIVYEGCGCAGSDITEFQSEIVTHDGNATGRRKSRVYRDVFGREIKSEILAWDGNVYSTQTNSYTVLDQTTNISNQAGTSGTQQNTVMTYDSYGRMQTRQLPIYLGTPQSSTPYTSYEYYDDGTLKKETDPRLATATYNYNNRGLVTSVSYNSPDSNVIPNRPSAAFMYDELGNRLTMSDGAGNVSYGYDSLGRMTSESRQFTMSDAPSGSFTVNYNYGLAGQLKMVKDPFNDQINYDHDKTGRLTSVTGAAPFGGVTNYLSGVQYRAWGALKNNRTYDSRMRLLTSGLITYQYNNASDMIFADMTSLSSYSQSFNYDHVGRLTGVSTPEITVPNQYVLTQSSPPNGLPPNYKVRPFTTSVSYDEFDNVTSSGSNYWHDITPNLNASPQSFNTIYVNNRAKKDGVAGKVYNNRDETWGYNAMGQVTYDTRAGYKFDVAGQMTRTDTGSQIYVNYIYDGDGRQVKFDQKREDGTTELRYRIYSTVLGGLLTDVGSTGQKIETRVYRFVYEQDSVRQVKAYSVPNYGSYPDTVIFEGSDPHGTRATVWDRNTNTYKTLSLAAPGSYVEDINWQGMKDRFVSNIGSQIAYGQQAASQYLGSYFSNIDPRNPGTGCSLDGVKTQCSEVFKSIRQGSLGHLDVFSPLGVFNGPGFTIGRTTDPDEDDLTKGYLIYVGDAEQGGNNGKTYEDCIHLSPWQSQAPEERLTKKLW